MEFLPRTGRTSHANVRAVMRANNGDLCRANVFIKMRTTNNGTIPDEDTRIVYIEAKVAEQVAVNVSGYKKGQMEWFKKLELLLGKDLPPLSGHQESVGQVRTPSNEN
ncbi:hypothetical protein Tco_1047682 [Tanacetum coccineum]